MQARIVVAERGGERESHAGSVLSVEPNTGLDLMNCEIMTRAEIKSDAQLTEAPRHLCRSFFLRHI